MPPHPSTYPFPISPENLESSDYERVRFFFQKFCIDLGSHYREGHWVFACYAAFPVMLTPDLLHKLWLNFHTYFDSDHNPHPIHHVAVSDVLQSGLCLQIGNGQYEMHEDIRMELLRWLQEEKRLHQTGNVIEQIAHFILRYIQEDFKGTDDYSQTFRQAQELNSLMYLQPQVAIQQIIKAFQETNPEEDVGEQLRLNLWLEQMKKQYTLKVQIDPNTDWLTQLKPIYAYGQGMKALHFEEYEEAVQLFNHVPEGDIITIPENQEQHANVLLIPTEVKRRIQKVRTINEPGGKIKKNLYGLLIGIEQYEKGKPITQFNTANIEPFNTYLESNHSDRNLHIKKLINQTASRENIIEAIQKDLSKAQKEDVVLIYFSGKTESLPAAKEISDYFAHGRELNLLCYDHFVKNHWSISQTELGILLHELYNQTQAEIVLVFESDSTEYISFIPPAIQLPPQVSSEISESSWKQRKDLPRPISTYLDGYFLDQQEKILELRIPHILLSASMETNHVQNGQGIFTRELIKALNTVQGEITYDELFSKVKLGVLAEEENQVPRMITYEGFDIQKWVFGKDFV